MREFDTRDIVVVSKHVKSSRKDGIYQKSAFKKKGPYRVLEKATPSSYRIQNLPFCEGLGMPGRKVRESVARTENIPSKMVIHKHVDGADTRFATMEGPLIENTLEKWLILIRIGT